MIPSTDVGAHPDSLERGARGGRQGIVMRQPEDPSGAHVRPAVADDAAAVAAVLREAFAEYAHLYTPEGLAATTPTAAQIQERWGDGPVWVAVRGAVIVGTVATAPRDGALYVRSMAVLPGVGGRGIGRSLLESIERFARERGHRRLVLSTTPFLDRAIRLYEQFGFRRSTDGPHELFGTPLFTMAKPLESGPTAPRPGGDARERST
jgi:GNAT superfamily N-acetyltransferase